MKTNTQNNLYREQLGIIYRSYRPNRRRRNWVRPATYIGSFVFALAAAAGIIAAIILG